MRARLIPVVRASPGVGALWGGASAGLAGDRRLDGHQPNVRSISESARTPPESHEPSDSCASAANQLTEPAYVRRNLSGCVNGTVRLVPSVAISTSFPATDTVSTPSPTYVAGSKRTMRAVTSSKCRSTRVPDVKSRFISFGASFRAFQKAVVGGLTAPLGHTPSAKLSGLRYSATTSATSFSREKDKYRGDSPSSHRPAVASKASTICQFPATLMRSLTGRSSVLGPLTLPVC